MALLPYGGVPPKFKSGTVPNSITPTGGNGILVGIGTDAPAYTLDVGGIINIPTTASTTAGFIYQNGVRFIHSAGATSNFFAGQQAGNSTVTGTGNVGIGFQALLAISTGTRNMAVGRGALGAVNTGTQNVALGQAAGGAITAGSNNFALGYSALANGDTDENIMIGQNSGITLVSGGANTFVGDQTDASVNSIGGSIALGARSTVTASGQWVVGHAAKKITDAYFGSGVTGTTLSDITFNASGGSGADKAGASLILAGGKGTGTGVGGSIIFKGAVAAGGSSSALNSLSTYMTILSTGKVGIGASTPQQLLNLGVGQYLQNLPTPVLISTTGVAGGTLVNGTTYYYVITARDVGYDGYYGGTSGETIISNEVSFVAGATNKSAQLAWTRVVGTNGYRIYRSTTSGVYTNTYIATAAVGATTYTDTGIATQNFTPPSATTAAITRFTSTGEGVVGGNLYLGDNSTATPHSIRRSTYANTGARIMEFQNSDSGLVAYVGGKSGDVISATYSYLAAFYFNGIALGGDGGTNVVNLGTSAGGNGILENNLGYLMIQGGSTYEIRFRIGTSQKAVIDQNGTMGIGVASPNANAILDVASTTKAFMPPRMTTTQKNAVGTPTAGMVVYDSTLGKLAVYTGAAWETVTSI